MVVLRLLQKNQKVIMFGTVQNELFWLFSWSISTNMYVLMDDIHLDSVEI